MGRGLAAGGVLMWAHSWGLPSQPTRRSGQGTTVTGAEVVALALSTAVTVMVTGVLFVLVAVNVTDAPAVVVTLDAGLPLIVTVVNRSSS